MHHRSAAACVLAVCSVLLAACEGGGGSPPPSSGVAPGRVSTPPPPPYDTYGQWNDRIESALPDFGKCDRNCNLWFPPKPETVQSPYLTAGGQPDTFNPGTDNWTGTWSGTAEGYRHLDPDGSGPAGKHWTGMFHLQIESTHRSRVRLWGENLVYDLAETGDPSTVGVTATEIPDALDDAWTGILSRKTGEMGFFSGAETGGQFYPAAPGDANPNLPSRALGHIRTADHTGIFEASR